jgi:hypothetical protein
VSNRKKNPIQVSANGGGVVIFWHREVATIPPEDALVLAEQILFQQEIEISKVLIENRRLQEDNRNWIANNAVLRERAAGYERKCYELGWRGDSEPPKDEGKRNEA